MPKYRKPFSACLGMPIAPLSTPFYEGTGGLYLKIGNEMAMACVEDALPSMGRKGAMEGWQTVVRLKAATACADTS